MLNAFLLLKKFNNVFEDERASTKLSKQIVGLSSLEILENPWPDGNVDFEQCLSFVPPAQ